MKHSSTIKELSKHIKYLFPIKLIMQIVTLACMAFTLAMVTFYHIGSVMKVENGAWYFRLSYLTDGRFTFMLFVLALSLVLIAWTSIYFICLFTAFYRRYVNIREIAPDKDAELRRWTLGSSHYTVDNAMYDVYDAAICDGGVFHSYKWVYRHFGDVLNYKLKPRLHSLLVTARLMMLPLVFCVMVFPIFIASFSMKMEKIDNFVRVMGAEVSANPFVTARKAMNIASELEKAYPLSYLCFVETPNGGKITSLMDILKLETQAKLKAAKVYQEKYKNIYDTDKQKE